MTLMNKEKLEEKLEKFRKRQEKNKKPKVVYVRTKKEIRELSRRTQKKYDYKTASQKKIDRARRERKSLYVPHESQQIIHDALNPHLSGITIMVIAGRRFGKTVMAVNEVIDTALEMPYSRVWYVAHTKDQAYEVAWRMMLDHWRDKEERIHPPFIPNYIIEERRKDRHYIKLFNGSLIQLRGIQDELFILGAGLEFVVLDEFAAMPWSAWYDTLKPMLLDKNGNALFICTIPDPKIHNITPEFIDMYESLFYGLEKDSKNKAFNFTSFQNPHISKEKIEADIKDLERKGMGADAKRLYHGEYTREYGLVFPKFNYDEHTVESFDVPSNWLKIMALDPHPQKPTYALWAAIDPRNHFWFYREKEFMTEDGRTMTIPEVADEIRKIESAAREKIKMRFIDPTFAKIEQAALGAKCVKDIYRDYGLFFLEADRNKDVFIDKVRMMLVEIPETSFHIFRTCPGTIRQISKYAWESWASSKARAERGAKNTPKKTDDDYVDDMKYILNSNVRYYSNIDQTKSYQATLHKRWAEGRIL